MTDENPRADEPAVTSEDVSVRRAPRYSRFIIIGAGLGAIVTFILTALYPADPDVGFGALFGYFALFGIPTGIALGGIVAVILDARATRRARQLTAEHTAVEAPPEDGDVEE